jgi:hypothetical protein
MQKRYLLFLAFLGSIQVSASAPINCEKPDQTVQIKGSYAKDWATTRLVEALTMARLKVDTEATSKNSVEYIELSDFVKNRENPFIAMGLKNGDRVYGTENLTFNGKNDLQFYTNILTGQSHCLKIDRANEIQIFRYILTPN